MSSSSTATGNNTTTHDSESPPPPENHHLRLLMDQRKRRRMESNRESAKRSRMRKQKHIDDLASQAAQLRKQNREVLTSLTVTAQHCAKVEAENSVLRAQAAELSQRLRSLNGILEYMSSFLGSNNDCNSGGFLPETEDYSQISNNFQRDYNGLMTNVVGGNNMMMMMGFGHNSVQCPIVASADVFGLY